MPMETVAMTVPMMMASAAARRSQKIQSELFARMMTLAPPERICDFPTTGRRTVQLPRVLDARAVTPSVAGDDALRRVAAAKIDGCFVTTRRRLLAPSVSGRVAARDLVVSLAGRGVVQEIYGIQVRARS